MCQGFEMQEFEVLEFMVASPRRRHSAGKFVPRVLASLEPADVPDYSPVGRLDQVYKLNPNQGLYLLEFTIDGKLRGYSGMSDNLLRRLQAHRLCARVMGIKPKTIFVYVATDPRIKEWRSREKALHQLMRTKAPNVLTNQKLELEFED